jgi:cyclophilin family peptidyl-prolyl cis-trans isomerase
MIYDLRVRRLPCLLLLAAAGCAGVPREAIVRAQDERAEASPALLEAARSRSAATRISALLAMARVQSPRYADAAAERLGDRRARVREAAAWTLGQLAAKPEALRPLLAASRSGPRAAAYEALGRAGQASDEPALAAGLRDPIPAVREKAALALFRLRFRGAVPEFSTATLRALRVAFSDPDPVVRRHAVYPFSRFAEPRLADALAAQCGEESDLWGALFSCRALGLIGRPAPWEELVAVIGPGDPLLRQEAVKSLGLLGRADYLPDSVFVDPSPHVRAAAADALAAAGDRKLAYKLDAVEEEGSVLVRAAVSRAYVKLKSPEQARRRLEKDAQDARWWVRSRAYLGLGELGLATATARGLLDADPRVAAAAVEALPPEEARRFLPGALASTATPVEVLGAAVEAAGKRPRAEYAEPLRRAYAGPTAERYPELADDVKRVYELLVSTLSLAAPPLPERVQAAAAPSPWLAARPPRATVTLATEKGEFDVQLAAAEAPIHAAAFLDGVRRGVYDGTTWHRVVSGFVVQGGDPRGSGWGDCGFSLRDEINRLPFDRGVLGMPKAGKDTGGCQLFITLVPTPHLDGRYTAFGRVTRGLEVVDRLEPGDAILKTTIR